MAGAKKITEKEWPYPLPVGTHVVARVKQLDLKTDVDVVGTVIRTLRPTSNTGGSAATVTYAVKIKDGSLIEVLASRTVPIDTSTAEGLDLWLGALDEIKVDSTKLPRPALTSDPSQVSISGTGMTYATTTFTTSSPNITWAGGNGGTITSAQLYTGSGGNPAYINLTTGTAGYSSGITGQMTNTVNLTADDA